MTNKKEGDGLLRSFEEKLILNLVFAIMVIVFVVFYYFFKNNRSLIRLIFIILVISSFFIAEYIVDLRREYKINQSVEMLDDHLHEKYPSEQWDIYYIETVGKRAKRIVLSVEFERENQGTYIYHFDGKKIKQAYFDWNYELDIPENYTPLFLE